ncbi:fibroblast growth factor-binding protein 1 [Trichomycterus rosablanca]|uniref:fibroblast growth factor-binding protein 1 n=1 Tax=Trichomycterus rosablanca TaxID=2290929 RepID=UPI002F359F9D
MVHVKGIALTLICICIMHDFLLTSAQAKKGEKDGKGKIKDKQQKLPPKPTSQKKIALKSQNEPYKGKFSNKDGMQCTWVALSSNIKEDGTFILSISCKKGTESLNCEYKAKPRLCTEYASSVEVYWKQIGRSLRKQKKLCLDPKAQLKAKMCGKSPKDAHFTLDTTAKGSPASGRRDKPCPNLANQQKLAKEYCSSTWSSFCTFFFAMVENDDC